MAIPPIPPIPPIKDHTKLTNIGTNTHAQIDTHISADATANVKTTAGQTINVSTAAELTAALAALAAAPSLLGNVIILLAAGTYTGNFTIPTLIYNGFTLTVEGTLSQTTSFTATGGVATTYGATGAFGEVQKSGGGLGNYQYQLVKNPTLTTSYAIIESSNNTTIYHFSQNNSNWGFPTVTNGQTVEVYNWATEITGGSNLPTITLGTYSNTIFKNIKISNTSGQGIIGTDHAITGTFVSLTLQRCYIKTTGFGAMIVYKSRVVSISTMFESTAGTVVCRADEGSSFYMRSACGNLFLAGLNSASLLSINGVSYVSFLHGHLIRGVGGTSSGINASASSLALLNVFIDNVGTGIFAQVNSGISTSGVKFTNIAVADKNPASAADASYIQ